MTKGPHRLVLDKYLDSAAERVLQGAGRDWKRKAQELRTLSDALKQAAQQAELRIGEQTLTGPAIRSGMEKSSASMLLKSEQLQTAGQALVVVGQQISDTRDARDAMAALGDKPPTYQAPAGTPGVEPTDEEIAAQAAASQARQNERTAWQTEYDRQEARSLTLTRQMDSAFLEAIPPMKDIHGQDDPTEPPPHVPSGPGGTYLPGFHQAPTGGGGGGSSNGTDRGVLNEVPRDDDDDDGGKDRDRDRDQDEPTPTVVTTTPTIVVEHPGLTPTTHLTYVPTEGPTSTVTGTSQNGVTYQPTGSQVSAPAATTAAPSGVSAAALGAAGGAGGLAGGAVRPGAMPTSAGSSAPVRAIGSTGRAGSAGALSRAAGSSAASRSTGTPGSAASRSAGSAGSSAGRGAAGGSSAGRGSAGGRGAASGSTSGSRSGGRGATGARGSGAAGAAAAGRAGRKGERDTSTDRDSLVYDQDWLGDDDVAPGVLD